MPALKLLTYTRGFEPYIWGFKTPTIIAIFMVIKDGKLLKRSFTELPCESYDIAETDTLSSGLSWIVQNVDDIEHHDLEIVFCGAGRNAIKKKIEGGNLVNSLGKQMELMKIIIRFNDVMYSAQGKTTTEEDKLYDLNGFAGKVFEMYYGAEHGYTHNIFAIVDGIRMMIVGEPEIRWRDGAPFGAWS